MPEVVQEYVSSRGQRIKLDRPGGVLRGVKLLGLRSRNGRRYLERALKQAMSLYEGAKVNVNHPAGDPLSARDYRDRLGVIRGVVLKPGEGLFGNLHYNPKHALAEQLMWDAKHSPENVGLSHNVVARTSRSADAVVVEEITRVQSVDLVADPASTSGLFEHEESDEGKSPAATPPVALAEENQRLQEQVERLEKEMNGLQLRRRIDELLCEHGLVTANESDALVSEQFLAELREFSDEEHVERAIVDRADAVRAAEARGRQMTPESMERPLVSDSQMADPDDSVQEFVYAVTSV